MNSTQNTHPSSNNYGSLSASYDPLSSHVTHSPSNISTTTGYVYPPSYYRQTSTPAYSNSLPQQQQQQAPGQVTRQMSSNYSVTSTIPPSPPPSNPSTSNVHPSSFLSPTPPFR